jgi:tetratricopeptide (TPR) repeat protein
MALNISNTAELLDRAVTAHMAGRLAEAEQLYLQTLACNHDEVGALRGMGVLAFQHGQLAVAERFLKRALEIGPDASVWANLGDVYGMQGRGEEAISCYTKAGECDPNYLPAYSNAAVVLLLAGRFSEATALWEKVVRLAKERGDPSHIVLAGQACNNLGEAFLQRGFAAEARHFHEEARSLHPLLEGIGSNFLRDLSYVPGVNVATVRAESDAWWETYARNVRPLEVERDCDPERKLRVGFVSPDFREHSVAHFLFPLFEQHDRERFEFTAYAAGGREDGYTERLARTVERWRKIGGMDDGAVARQIDADEIDVLIDLAGHTGDNRLRVFAYRPAPVQATYLGYPATVGGTAIEWRITDAVADPAGTEGEFAEKLWRLERCAWCFRPAADIAAVAERPADRPLTFGSFNALAKVSAESVKLWAAVLKAAPGSRMFLKASSLQEVESRRHVEQLFAAEGVGAERLRMEGRQATMEEHLGRYAEVDVALDTAPYGGTTTTCEALWMGVPVVTVAGERHASRVGASLLTAAGLGELVARDEAAFVAAALRAAGAGVARGAALRTKVEGSALRDEAGFARAFEGAVRGMWRAWCAE